jgi:hypothetical protein
VFLSDTFPRQEKVVVPSVSHVFSVRTRLKISDYVVRFYSVFVVDFIISLETKKCFRNQPVNQTLDLLFAGLSK